MSDDLKFIVQGVNGLLSKNFNLITFNALNPEDLLQVLSDVLSEIQEKGSNKTDIRAESPDKSSIRIFSTLRVLKYQPKADPTIFRQGLIKGEAETIHPILHWLLSNVDVARQRAYLARFLVKVEVPADYLGDPEVSALYDQYTSLLEEFKKAHKERENGKKNGEAATELKADVEAMEKEREVVISRVERLKAKAEPGLHLLGAAQALRRERDRERELAQQKEQQLDILNTTRHALQRAERELQNLRQANSGLTPQMFLQQLSEEVTVLNAMAKERLPSELSIKKVQVDALSSVANSHYITPDEILTLRNRLDSAAREVQALLEARASEAGADKIAPFRQQAAAVTSIKRNALEKLEKAKAEYDVVAAKLQEKKEAAKHLIGEPFLKDDELKRYAARLKSKNVSYKRAKAELDGLRAENGVLSRTQAILDNQVVQVKSNDARELNKTTELPNDYALENAAAVNEELLKTVVSMKTKLAPLLNEIRPLRQKARELDEAYAKAHKSHSSVEASMESGIMNLTGQVNKLQQEIDNNVTETKRLTEESMKLQKAEERIQMEMKNYTSQGSGRSLREELHNQIAAEEKQLVHLREEEKQFKEKIDYSNKQTQQWKNLIAILECKLRCVEENKKRDGIVVRGGGAETLILQ